MRRFDELHKHVLVIAESRLLMSAKNCKNLFKFSSVIGEDKVISSKTQQAVVRAQQTPPPAAT